MNFNINASDEIFLFLIFLSILVYIFDYKNITRLKAVIFYRKIMIMIMSMEIGMILSSCVMQLFNFKISNLFYYLCVVFLQFFPLGFFIAIFLVSLVTINEKYFGKNEFEEYYKCNSWNMRICMVTLPVLIVCYFYTKSLDVLSIIIHYIGMLCILLWYNIQIRTKIKVCIHNICVEFDKIFKKYDIKKPDDIANLSKISNIDDIAKDCYNIIKTKDDEFIIHKFYFKDR